MRVEGRCGRANGHPLREERLPVGARHEVAPGAADDAEVGGDGREHVSQAPASRPPELVRVGVQDPVRSVLDRSELRHASDPLALAQVVPRLANELQDALRRVPLEDLRRAVGRPVVGGDDEVDAGAQVVRDLGVHDVRLVADEQRQHELHRRCRLERQVDAALGQLDPLVGPDEAESTPCAARIARSGSCER